MIEIRWHGRGGQGAFTAAKTLGAAALLENKYALSFPSFGPERRGAPIQAFTKIDDKSIINRSEVRKCDYVVFLDETLFSISILHDLKEAGKVILNSAFPEKYREYPQIITIDANQIALEALKAPITNTAMLGALIGASKIIEVSSVIASLADYLPEKILAKNVQIIQKAYEIGKEVSK